MDNQWSRTTRYITFFLTLAFLLWFFWAIGDLVGPLIISALLAYVLNPPINYVNSVSKLPRTLVVTLVYVLLISLLGMAIFFLTPVAIAQWQILSVELQNILIELRLAAVTQIAALGLNINVDDTFNTLENFFTTGNLGADQIFRVLSATSRNLAWVLIILVTTFYLLQDWHRLREWIFNIVPPTYRGDVRRLYGEIKDTWQAYLWGQILLMTIVGLLSGVGSAAIGLQAAVVLGLIAGILDVIPSVGPAVAMIVATLVAWFQGPPDYLPMSDTWYMILVLGIYVAIQSIENIWLRPKIMGQSLKMHPGIVFLAVMGSLAMGGILVALLIVPVIGTAGVIGAYLRARMFGLEPWETDLAIEPAAPVEEIGFQIEEQRDNGQGLITEKEQNALERSSKTAG